MKEIKPVRIENQTFALHDGHYCFVAGRIFGPWANAGAALAGLQTEERRAAKRKEKEAQQ